MYHLNQFLKFDSESFFKDKQLVVCGCSEWKDYTTKAHMGTRVDVMIAMDNTPYVQKPGEFKSNAYERLALKVSRDVHIPVNSVVVPVNVTATVYGQYRNQLSVKCTDIQVVQSEED